MQEFTGISLGQNSDFSWSVSSFVEDQMVRLLSGCKAKSCGRYQMFTIPGPWCQASGEDLSEPELGLGLRWHGRSKLTTMWQSTPRSEWRAWFRMSVMLRVWIHKATEHGHKL